MDIIAARAGQVDRDTAEGHLAREIVSVGMPLAALLDEHHSHLKVYGEGVERLVRRLVTLEEDTWLLYRDLGVLFIKKIALMGFGGATAPPSTT